jgi:hypothetical protein
LCGAPCLASFLRIVRRKTMVAYHHAGALENSLGFLSARRIEGVGQAPFLRATIAKINFRSGSTLVNDIAVAHQAITDDLSYQ